MQGYRYDRRIGSDKTAILVAGPIGRVLNKVWNQVHDIEYDLKNTARDYADAAHFMGGPAEEDAEAMLKEINAAVKALEGISKGVFNKLAAAEAEFVKKHGEPGKYSDDMRRKIFPR